MNRKTYLLLALLLTFICFAIIVYVFCNRNNIKTENLHKGSINHSDLENEAVLQSSKEINGNRNSKNLNEISMVKVMYLGHGRDNTAAQRAYYLFQEIDNSERAFRIYKNHLSPFKNANIKNIVSLVNAMPYQEKHLAPLHGRFSETNFKMMLLIPEFSPSQFTETWQIIELQNINECAAQAVSHP